jgi:hypothetical protein
MRQEHRLVAHGAGVTNFDVDAVEIQDWIEGIERASLASLQILAHGVRHA